MKGVYFDNIHSFDDLGLILSKAVIEPPSIKTKKIEVPGADGVINLTQFDGNVHYYNRKISLTFTARNANKYWNSIISMVSNALHGKEMDIVLEDDPAYIWHGVVSVKEQFKKKTIGTIEVEVDAEPYKYSKFTSTDDVEWDSFDFNNGIMQNLNNILVSDVKEVSFYGYRKSVVPVFMVTESSTISVIFNGKETQLNCGENKILDIVIKEGINTLTFKGEGLVEIRFRGGSL